jgi:hypothetical protein
MKNTIEISKNLYSIFKNLEGYYKDKKTIFLITDNELESIPFEIIGEKNMLEETHTIVYLPSILSTFLKYNEGKNAVNLIDASDESILNNTEFISIKESGIPYDKQNKIKSGIGHIQGKIFIDSADGKLFIGSSLFNESTAGAEILYIPEFHIGKKISCNEFIRQNSIYGINSIIINDARIHDVNNAIFVNTLYNGINEKKSLITAFQQAKQAVRSNKKYSDPFCWAGIRLYSNSMLKN